MVKTTHLADGWTFAAKGWESRRLGFSRFEPLEAVVPGAVHLDLERHGIIPDSHARMHEIGVQWVDDEDWIFRCVFDWQPDPTRPLRELRFGALDTVATIRLNGEELGTCDNMFLPYEYDVSSKLRRGSNEIEIEFASVERIGQERRAEYFASHDLSDPIVRFGARSFVRKMQCAYGWDWGPVLRSCGIMRPVTLFESAGRIAEFSTRTHWNEDGAVTIQLDCETRGEGTIVGQIWPSDGSPLHPEDEAQEWVDGRVTLRHLRRWNPGDWEPVRYEVAASLVAPDGSVLDSDVRTVGFSRNRLLREPDAFGESFEFEINGRRLWIRGANWIPETSFICEITRARLRERLEQARDLGCNMLRVWGGGQYESDEFYELCDELGILVWQDFPHACGYYPDDGEYAEVARREAEYHVRRLRIHPCLALWCGNNENLQMWQQKWDGGPSVHPPRLYGERLYDEIYAQVVAEHDPNHGYIPTSPCGESEPDCNGGKIGDSHYWDVWHGRGDWKHYADSDTRFSSEYGFASSCALATWTECLSQDDWSHDSPAVRWHDKTGKGYKTFVGYTELHYPSPSSLEEWVYRSQLNQRDAMRFGVEHFRRFVPCRGSLIWQLNDIWPAQSWSLIDSAGRYKAAAYEMRRLYADRMISLVRKGATMETWAVNDAAEPWVGSIVVEARDTETGELRRRASAELRLEPDARLRILDFDLAGMNVSRTIVGAHVALSEAGDPPNQFDARTWRLLGEPKEARLAAPAPLLVSSADEGTLAVRTTTPIVDLQLTSHGDVLPFEENFVTRSSPGVVRVRTRETVSAIEARSLAGEHAIRWTRSPFASDS